MILLELSYSYRFQTAMYQCYYLWTYRIKLTSWTHTYFSQHWGLKEENGPLLEHAYFHNSKMYDSMPQDL